MNDKELADKVVALGVGGSFGGGNYYSFENSIALDHQWGAADVFVQDWRVAGALMEKLMFEKGQWLDIEPDGCAYRDNGDLPRAIIEACVEALS